MTLAAPTTSAPAADEPGGSPRYAALVSSVARLRGRTGVPPVERVLLVLGALCLPTGIILIILGWYGAAHTVNVYEQNSYILSGGFLGVGLIIAGGFLYFGHWMMRQVQVAKSALQQVDRNFERMESQLAAVTAVVGRAQAGGEATATPAAPSARADVARAAGGLVATERGSLAHRPDCQVVFQRSNLKAVAPGGEGYRPCRICKPFD